MLNAQRSLIMQGSASCQDPPHFANRELIHAVHNNICKGQGTVINAIPRPSYVRGTYGMI